MTIKGLYLVIGPDDCLYHNFETVLKAALRAGVRFVQLRDKKLSDDAFLLRAKQAKQLCAQYNAALILNDRIHLVKEAKAQGCHLGQEDMNLKEARALLGEEMIIGISIGSMSECVRTPLSLASYCAYGPIFKTNSKLDAGKPLGLKDVSTLCSNTDRPCVGIGGINVVNCAELKAVPLDGIAVISAITAARNPERTARAMIQQFSKD